MKARFFARINEGNLAAIRSQLWQGYDCNADTIHEGHSAIYSAAYAGHAAIVLYFLNHAIYNHSRLFDAMNAAIAGNRIEVIAVLIATLGDSSNYTADINTRVMDLISNSPVFAQIYIIMHDLGLNSPESIQRIIDDNLTLANIAFMQDRFDLTEQLINLAQQQPADLPVTSLLMAETTPLIHTVTIQYLTDSESEVTTQRMNGTDTQDTLTLSIFGSQLSYISDDA